MNPSTNVYYCGTGNSSPERTHLRAGPLSLIFEQGDLRYVRLGEEEILRRVYFALRTKNWDTLPLQLSNLRIDAASDSFRISYDARNKQDEIDFVWEGAIVGEANGAITFSMKGEARSTFLRNRLGLCVLHPIKECAGKACKVETLDGARLETEFPRFISPHQPFMNMGAISHEVTPGVWAEVRFEGEVFETEDQRNWTDASYKTYSTPLRLPYPVRVQAGTQFAQSITLSLKGSIPHSPAEKSSRDVNFVVGGTPALSVPAIGLGVASHRQPLSSNELARLRALNLGHLRVEMNLGQPVYESYFVQAAAQAAELRLPLEVAITLADAAEDELTGLRALIDRLKPRVGAWLIFHDAEKSTSGKWIQLARHYLSSYDPRAKVGGGANSYFAELNRGRPPIADVDLVCFSVNPQVHAFDNATMVENLQGQAFAIESARQFVGQTPIAVTPITLRARYNPNAQDAEASSQPKELPPQVDPRQMSLFGAGWTAGSLKYLAEAGADTVTYYETTGWRGVMETETGSCLPEKFPSSPGCVFPLYHVLADVGEFAGGGVVPSTSDAPLRVDGLALKSGKQTRILLANVTPEPQVVRIMDSSLGDRVYVKVLDERSVEAAMISAEAFRAEPGVAMSTAENAFRLELCPYAVARIDSPGVD